MLGSSILGFHTQFHCNNFVDTVDRFLEARVDRETFTVSFGGKLTAVRRYPISIAWPPEAEMVEKPVPDCRSNIRQMTGLPARSTSSASASTASITPRASWSASAPSNACWN